MDYKELGFKCGIEIHQQLEGKKLFCNCPTEIRKEGSDYEVVRKLRASFGETGEFDQAAKHEQAKDKDFHYKGYNDLTCLVELDEEPPHPINPVAVKAAIQIAHALKCKLIDEIQVMRKVVVDGSNTSAFQRTMLIGLDGYVDVDGKKITIETVCLEEEACQVLKRTEDHDIYNLSRLGIPLIEIATGPDITTPEDCRVVAEKIGMILRSIPECKRGIGSTRQDVNVSITGHPRIEIKGFQDLKSIPKIIEFEVKRQQKEIERKSKEFTGHVRKAEHDMTTSYLRPMPGAARMYPETDIPAFAAEVVDVETVELLDDKIDEISSKYNIAKENVKDIVKQGVDFESYIKEFSVVNPTLLAELLVSIPKELRRKHNIEVDLKTDKGMAEVLRLLNLGKIAKNSIIDILVDYHNTGKMYLGKYELMDDKQIEKIVDKVLSDNKGAPIGALIGKVMAQTQGKADGKTVSRLISEKLKKKN
ncbi:Glu-tRNA(Gln) amidotransferase subunit GatE [Candidatus Woesearchaeota archaeon]|nr:Glu-tRNA(Gln) amidotransferase subunit GatE [Candidatus Woesearchaeota archaeon]